MANEPYKSVSTFALPDAYQQQAAEARRRRRMAEMLAQQAYQPGDIQNAPIPAAAPFVQGLQAYLTARAGRKADEAEESARETASREARQLFRALTEEGDTTTNAVQPAMTPMAKTVTAPQFEDGRITAPASIEMGAPPPMTAPETQLSRYNLTPGQRRAAALEGMLTSENPMLQKVAGAIYPTLAPKTPETKTMEFGGRLLNVTGGQATPVTMDGVAVTEPTKQKTRTAAQDFGGFIRTYYSDGSYTDERKTLAPSKPTVVGGRGQPPSGYRWTPEGNLEKISGGPADKPESNAKPMTEVESNSATFADRMAISLPELDRAAPSRISTAVAGAPYGLGTGSVPEEDQTFFQAKDDFIAAVLRKESGAAIGANERADAEKQYIPQPGDKPAVLAQKKRAREAAFVGMQRAAGQSYKPTTQVLPQSAKDMGVTQQDWNAMTPEQRKLFN